MNFATPSPDLAARFYWFTRGLCSVLGKYASDRSSRALVETICKWLLRRNARFGALVTRFHAGTLPKPRGDVGARAPSNRAPRDRVPDPIPRRRAYLLNLGRHEAAAYLGYLELIVADPYMKALFEASPQARRLLRPLWWILSPHPLPEALRPAQRPPPEAPTEVAPRPIQTVASPAPSRRCQARTVRPSGSEPPIPA